jgi:hypothetical protein
MSRVHDLTDLVIDHICALPCEIDQALEFCIVHSDTQGLIT